MTTPNDSAGLYRIWGADNVAYGPVELPTIIDWIGDERVTPETWVFLEAESRWRQAAAITELQLALAPNGARPASPATGPEAAASPPIKPGSLRRVKVFADMEQAHLESFLQYMQIVRFRQFSHVVRKGEHGDAMYLVLEGELRAMTLVDGKECPLSTMGVGDFFGEISLLDEGPRSADVVANEDSTLLRISAAAFRKLMREAPALAAPFLLALSRSIVARVRGLTKWYEDSVHLARATQGVGGRSAGS